MPDTRLDRLSIEVFTPSASIERVAPRRQRRVRMLGSLVVLLLAVASIAAVVINRGPSRQERYLAALDTAQVRNQFTTVQNAVANARRTCTNLEAGEAAEGFARDRIGVQIYCSEFAASFKVLPTPEEQEASYLGALRTAGLAGKFSSDQAAVAHAKSVCTGMDGGGKQQGMPEDRLGVQVYCGKFLDGFKVLRTLTLKGTFTLIDSDPGVYYPSIVASRGACEGANGYSDVSAGTQVRVRNADGKLLAQTTLQGGRGTRNLCALPFEVELTEGETTYQFETGRRGSIGFSFAELSTSGVHLSLGS